MAKFSVFLLILFFISGINVRLTAQIVCGADQPEKYLSLLQKKRVGLVVNHTSLKGNAHLIDFLKSEKINVKRIFAPEHGFRGEASAGEEIKGGIDKRTGIQVVSLYGKNKKPTEKNLKDLDVVIFDIQDVGCRFYTYISTLHLVIEACAEYNISLLILDRPNPNGDYVAGPVLKPEFISFVGMVPIPIVHGCTIGEIALMMNGENWTTAKTKCKIDIVPVLNYTHSTKYEPPVPPSPNLPNYRSIRLYPSICFFEATKVSLGRGTEFPFQVLGGLDSTLGNFRFTPVDIPGVAIDPVNEGQVCYGVDLRTLGDIPEFTLSYFLDFYWKFQYESDFIDRENWFNLLAGTDVLLAKIRGGNTESEILKVFEPELETYKTMRKKYLLYPDFE